MEPEWKTWFSNNPNFKLSEILGQIQVMMKQHNIPRATRNYIRKYKLEYTYDSRMKTSYLLYFNEIHNRRYSFIIYPIVSFKLNRLSKYGI